MEDDGEDLFRGRTFLNYMLFLYRNLFIPEYSLCSIFFGVDPFQSNFGQTQVEFFWDICIAEVSCSICHGGRFFIMSRTYKYQNCSSKLKLTLLILYCYLLAVKYD